MQIMMIIRNEWTKLTKFLESDMIGKKQIGRLTFFKASALFVKLTTPSFMLVEMKIQTKKPMVTDGSISSNGIFHKKLHRVPMPTDPNPSVNTSQRGPRTLRRYLACRSVCDMKITAGTSFIPATKSALNFFTVDLL